MGMCPSQRGQNQLFRARDSRGLPARSSIPCSYRIGARNASPEPQSCSARRKVPCPALGEIDPHVGARTACCGAATQRRHGRCCWLLVFVVVCVRLILGSTKMCSEISYAKLRRDKRVLCSYVPKFLIRANQSSQASKIMKVFLNT